MEQCKKPDIHVLVTAKLLENTEKNGLRLEKHVGAMFFKPE